MVVLICNTPIRRQGQGDLACLKTKTKAEHCFGGGGSRPWHRRLRGVSHVFFKDLTAFPCPLGGVNTSLHFSPHPTSAKWLCGQGRFRFRGREGISS